jgi:hypothetical protein
MTDDSSPRVPRLLRWIGRAFALILLSLWGAFLVQHVSDLAAGKPWATPPSGAFLATALHVLVLAGFALQMWKPLPGSILVILATAAYAVQLSPQVFPWILFVNLLPIPFFAAAFRPAGPAGEGVEAPSGPAQA